MAFILHLVFGLKNFIFERLGYIFRCVSRIKCKVQNAIYLRIPELKVTSRNKEQKCSDKINCSSKGSVFGKGMTVKQDKGEHNKGLELISSNKNENVLDKSKHPEVLPKNCNVLEHQTRSVGDSCNTLTPISRYFEPGVKLKDNICASWPDAGIKQKNRSKVNTISKHTISLDILSSKADVVLRLLDELNETSQTTSHSCRDEAKEFGAQDNLINARNCSETKKSKCDKFSQMKSTSATQDEEKTKCLCFCLHKNQCLLSVDSEDNIGGCIENKLLAHEDEDSAYDYFYQEELLTPEELESVTGSDDDWLYKPVHKQFIYVTA